MKPNLPMYRFLKLPVACLLSGSLLINAASLTVPNTQTIHTTESQLNTESQRASFPHTVPSDELLILWKEDVTAEQKSSILAPYTEQATITQDYDDFMLLSALSITDAISIHESLSRQELISAIDYNNDLVLCSSNDEYSTAQWPLHNTGTFSKLVGSQLVDVFSIADVDMDIPEGWTAYKNRVSSSKEVIVAVIDTGVDYMHPDLENVMWVNKGEIPGDGIDNDGNGYVDDIYGWDFYNDDNTVCHYEYDSTTDTVTASSQDKDNHGTHCAGIIAAQANNKIGIAGVASNINSKIMSLKIHGGPNGKGTVSDAILAIKYATAMGASICNMSWGSTTYNKALELAIAESPMLFVTAAGNTGANNDRTPMYPANYDLPNIISVTFINQYGALTTKSNYGKTTVDIAAPGAEILSTVVQGYDTLSGSSMAAAHISGMAAMLYSISDHLSPITIKELIMKSIKPLLSLNDYIIAPGIPSASKMMSCIDSLSIDNNSPTIHVMTNYDKDVIELEVDAADTGGSGMRILAYLSGRQNAAAFNHGLTGMIITDGKVRLNKGGWYTFYASDYANNETCLVFNVPDDTKAPKITSGYRYSIDGKNIYIDLVISDEQSGLKTVKYAKGAKTAEDFKAASSGVSLDVWQSKASIKLNEPGEYTIYAADYRGNKTVQVVNVDARPVTSISIPSSYKTLAVNDIYKLNVTVRPNNATEGIYYVSSNPSVVSVSQWGTIHAKAKGTAIITISSVKGISRKIKITVE